jgi:hypothetical protein
LRTGGRRASTAIDPITRRVRRIAPPIVREFGWRTEFLIVLIKRCLGHDAVSSKPFGYSALIRLYTRFLNAASARVMLVSDP